MKLKNNFGQITVFLSIILLAVIILAGVLVDASRAGAAEAIVKKSVESAARSVLADYSSKLKENYGIFSFTAKNEDVLNDEVRKYLSRNLMIQEEGEKNNGNAKFYGFNIERVNVTPVFNLSENEVMKSQILEYMKYRAPKEIVDGFLERLSAVRNMGKMSEAYKKKVEIDKALGRMDKVQQSLKKSIDGTGENDVGGNFVNGFNVNGTWLKAFDCYIASCNKLDMLNKDLELINTEIASLQQDTSDSEESTSNDENTSDETDKTKKESKSKRLIELFANRNSIVGSISNLKGSIDSIWNNICYTMTDNFIEPNEKALQQIDKILELGKNAESAIGELEAFMKENFNDEDDYTGDFSVTLSEDIKNIKGLILGGQRANIMIGQLEKNTDVLTGIMEKLDQLNDSLKGTTGSAFEISVLKNDILKMVGDYGNIEYTYEKNVKEKVMDDPRKSQAAKLKEALLGKLFDDRNYTDAGIVGDELPSNKKLVSKNFNDEDAPYIFFENTSDENQTGAKGSVEYRGALGKIAEEADLYDEEGGFQVNALDFAGGIGKLLEGDISKLRDNIYINEYIMGMFKNQVPALQKSEREEKKYFLNGVARDEKETFYESEVEYILHGNASEIANKTMTDAQILLLRFGADTLHVYMDPKKKELSVVTATAIAGWWTGGAGIPILSNLIMCAWGMGEALIDLKDLKEGKQVPLYKSQGDWKLDIGLPKTDGPKTDSRLSFSYYDYLRLFLLAMNEDKKLGRLEDLIEMNFGLNNPGFKASGCNTYVRVEAVVSMNNLFVSKLFMPANIRDATGRRTIKVLVYEGY